MRPLNVVESISLDAPQVEPAVALRMLSFDRAFAAVTLACCAKLKWGSKVTPKILGFRSTLSGLLRSKVDLSKRSAISIIYSYGGLHRHHFPKF